MVEYQLLTLRLQRSLLRERLKQAEAQHFEVSVREELFEAQEDEGKADALDSVRKELEQSEIAVRLLQGKLVGLEMLLDDTPEGTPLDRAHEVYEQTE